MKKTFALSMVAMFAIALAFTSCGKYEEGPAFSLRSKKSRVAGDWKIKEYVEDGTTVSPEGDAANMTITFKKDGKGTYSDGTNTSDFEWEFGDKKESIKFTSTFSYTDPYSGQTISETHTSEEDILKLKEKEMWLKDEDGDEIHYEKK